MNIAVILVAGTNRQNICFWPSYYGADPGVNHDLIVIHRDMCCIPDITNNYGNIILENKINNGVEIKHKAFGAYRHYWNKYKDKYDFFAFVSDDVIIKSDDWLHDAVYMLNRYSKLGFVGTQIFNGNLNQYPHPSHCRAPIWFGKAKALNQLDWEFNSDHEGEMNLGLQFLASGYFGAQIGNKIDVAYDALDNQGQGEGDHVSSLMEVKLGHCLKSKFLKTEKQDINNLLYNMLINSDDSMFVNSKHQHIGTRRVISQLQPFNGLVFDKSVDLAKDCIITFPFGINILKEEICG